MTEQLNKTSILKQMSTSYAALEEILTSLDKKQYFTEGVIPGWSIKDVLAHIASWHHRLLKWLDAAARNEEPTISGPDNVEEMDALNAQFYQENKALPLDEVMADFRSSYQQIMDITQVMAEEDLMNPHRFAWSQGRPLWHLIAGDTFEHYQEHTAQIQEWLDKS
ncbi:MAG TPA: ClbS/DfsB family four-helix bundle protein [Ktedonobacteraceae bacterium]|nr:ClbS/DfsB family four-helix bundle protein [Ktedonobacteraceae bacterium]